MLIILLCVANAGTVGLAIARNPGDGSLFVKNEILLRLMPEMNLPEFKKLLRQIGGRVMAGNEPTGKPFYPAAYSSVIGVSALEPGGKAWENSNYGSFVTLYAPGFATLPVGYKGDPGAYAGTSISTAFVANSIANYLSRNPEATNQEVFNALVIELGKYSATK